MPSTYRLTKSKYVRGLQCIKAMYFDVYRTARPYYSPETLAKFREGRAFEADFHALFPDAVDVSKRLGKQMDRYAALTQSLLAQEGEVTLFEAGFVYDEVLVLADVVHKHADGTIDIYEVKNGTEAKEVFRRDVALQHYVISHNLSHIAHYYLLHNDGEGGFVKLDLLAEAEQQHATIGETITCFKAVIDGSEPSILPGEHCDTPYECPYKHHCRRMLRR